jgi:DNA-binding XRE family transcriptional regulator
MARSCVGDLQSNGREGFGGADVNPNGRKPKTKGFGVQPPPVGHLPCPRCGGTGTIPQEGISIGDRFTMCRKQMGMTQAEIAPKLQIGRAQLANLEGDRSRPSIEVLSRAADTFGTTVDYLLGRAK